MGILLVCAWRIVLYIVRPVPWCAGVYAKCTHSGYVVSPFPHGTQQGSAHGVEGAAWGGEFRVNNE
eukprot:scaffold9307_cov166-Amphora_coffeaeformis.AAC.2